MAPLTIKFIKDLALTRMDFGDAFKMGAVEHKAGQTLEVLQIVPSAWPEKSNIQLSEDEWLFNIPNDYFQPQSSTG